MSTSVELGATEPWGALGTRELNALAQSGITTLEQLAELVDNKQVRRLRGIGASGYKKITATIDAWPERKAMLKEQAKDPANVRYQAPDGTEWRWESLTGPDGKPIALFAVAYQDGEQMVDWAWQCPPYLAPTIENLRLARESFEDAYGAHARGSFAPSGFRATNKGPDAYHGVAAMVLRDAENEPLAVFDANGTVMWLAEKHTFTLHDMLWPVDEASIKHVLREEIE